MKNHIHIKWKDSFGRTPRTEDTYRHQQIRKESVGWVISTLPDLNIYATKASALNAIDKHLGGHSQQGAAPTRNKGIRIIGKK